MLQWKTWFWNPKYQIVLLLWQDIFIFLVTLPKAPIMYLEFNQPRKRTTKAIDLLEAYFILFKAGIKLALQSSDW